MQFFVPFQHLNKLLDPSGADLSFFGGLNPEKYSVPVLSVQSFEKGLRTVIFIERSL